MAQKFRKKPVEIEAVQWKGNNYTDICEFTGDWGGNKLAHEDAEEAAQRSGNLFINTLEGIMRATLGDWIIKGVKGEFYPCKPDIFITTYELVD